MPWGQDMRGRRKDIMTTRGIGLLAVACWTAQSVRPYIRDGLFLGSNINISTHIPSCLCETRECWCPLV